MTPAENQITKLYVGYTDPTFERGGVRVVGLLDKAMMQDIGVMV